MNQKLQTELKQQYPEILSGISIDVGDGWYNLLDMLCGHIQGYLIGNDLPFMVNAIQVKTKFGALRFYWELIEFNGHNKILEYAYEWRNAECTQKYIEGVISFASTLSAHTCEHCGQKLPIAKYCIEDLNWTVGPCVQCKV